MYSTLINIVDNIKFHFKDLLETLLNAEREEYLKNNQDTKGNGFYTRSLGTKQGTIDNLKVPRTRDGSFKSQLIPRKHSDASLDQLVTELFIEGVSTRRIEDILKKCFKTSLSHTSIANIAKAGEEEILQWTQRSLDTHYACIFIDAFYFPLKRGTSSQEAVFVALAITPQGHREILGYWIPGGCEGAANWEEILRDIQNRGVQQVDFIIADGLTGIQGAISRVFPRAKYQYCVLHGIRSTINKVRASDKKELSSDLKWIYQALDFGGAKIGLWDFRKKWEKKYPKVVSFWENNFIELTNFMVLPRELWKYVYTTNWVERSHKEIKRRLKAMEQFQSEESAEGILYLLYSRQNEKYSAGINHWKVLYEKYCQALECIDSAEAESERKVVI